jgi:threonine dehydrogenase-like Zn-dependent dehydrogenase
MKAIVKRGPTVALCDVPIPDVAPDQVRVRVAMVGVCRTDIYVARGQIDCADPVILGHEFAGTIDAVGLEVTTIRRGQRVAVRPIYGCRTCTICQRVDEINCPYRTMLGVDHDGAFAEFVSVPAHCAFPINDQLSWQAAAYAEPLAAAMAVLGPTRLARKILILGRNRFALLLQRLLVTTNSRRDVVLCDLASGDAEPRQDFFDVVIETGLTSDTLPRMIRAARPEGTLVLKSRQPHSIPFDVLPAILKRLTIHAVNYQPFYDAVKLLPELLVSLKDLMGPVSPLEAFAEVFDLAEGGESAKLFFDPTLEHVRDHR